MSHFAQCFIKYRDPELTEYSMEELAGQRVYGLNLGYDDLNDHDQVRHDPPLPVLVGKEDPTGQDSLRHQDRGNALAGKSTHNRLELTPAEASATERYKKIAMKP